MNPRPMIEAWADELPEPCTRERVHGDLWYVRLPGVARRWIGIEVLVDEKTTKLTSHVIPEPEDRLVDVYRLLLRHNHAADKVAFSLDGREAVICLTGRIANPDVTGASLDEMAGAIVTKTEATFRSILEIGYAAQLKGRSP